MSADTRPGFTRRFWRAFIRTLAIVMALVLLAAIAVGGYFGFMDLQRSFDNVAVRMDAMDQTTDLLRDDVNAIMGENPEQQSRTVSALSENLQSLETRVSTIQSELASDIETQQTVLETLTTDLEAASTTGTSLTDDVALLNTALTALQGDINENGSRIDELGGEIDGVSASVTALDNSLITVNEQQAALTTAQSETPEVQKTLALFRVWELITRARFRLLENNIGLATADIETAVRTIDVLVKADPDNEGVAAVQARLALAFVSLPDDVETAVTDLETAWDELDAIFAEDIFAAFGTEAEVVGEELEAASEEEAEPTTEAEPTEEAPAATATTEPEVTATPEPTATPSP
ncbi:MAG: hypothetical protein GY943_36675 [Chloroflexi bacterium]|nr:hypothetical protein [Chloroflexota bacterium]